MILGEERRNLVLGLNKFFLFELRKILWKNALSAQEFVSYVIKLLVTGDQRVYDIMIEAKKDKAKKTSISLLHTDEESLYSLIEQTLKENKVNERE